MFCAPPRFCEKSKVLRYFEGHEENRKRSCHGCQCSDVRDEDIMKFRRGGELDSEKPSETGHVPWTFWGQDGVRTMLVRAGIST